MSAVREDHGARQVDLVEDPADWEALSALADGELDPRAAKDLRARIAREPALAETLAAIEGLRRDVQRWTGAPAHRPAHRMRGIAAPVALLVGGALAASMAWIAMPPAAAPPPPAPAMQAEATPPVPEALRTMPLLDLSDDGLELVVMTAAGGVAVRDYAGPNGCRIRHEMTLGPPEPSASDLRRDWTVDGVHHALVADGMNPRRFAALADYAEARTGAWAASDLRLARVTNAAICAA